MLESREGLLQRGTNMIQLLSRMGLLNMLLNMLVDMLRLVMLRLDRRRVAEEFRETLDRTSHLMKTKVTRSIQGSTRSSWLSSNNLPRPHCSSSTSHSSNPRLVLVIDSNISPSVSLDISNTDILVLSLLKRFLHISISLLFKELLPLLSSYSSGIITTMRRTREASRNPRVIKL
jgi:hypothetical protein